MDYIVFARNARGVQGLRASRRARWDCPARDNRMPMQVPAGAEGASAAEGRAASDAAAFGRWGQQTRVIAMKKLERVAPEGKFLLSHKNH